MNQAPAPSMYSLFPGPVYANQFYLPQQSMSKESPTSSFLNSGQINSFYPGDPLLPSHQSLMSRESEFSLPNSSSLHNQQYQTRNDSQLDRNQFSHHSPPSLIADPQYTKISYPPSRDDARDSLNNYNNNNNGFKVNHENGDVFTNYEGLRSQYLEIPLVQDQRFVTGDQRRSKNHTFNEVDCDWGQEKFQSSEDSDEQIDRRDEKMLREQEMILLQIEEEKRRKQQEEELSMKLIQELALKDEDHNPATKSFGPNAGYSKQKLNFNEAFPDSQFPALPSVNDEVAGWTKVRKPEK